MTNFQPFYCAVLAHESLDDFDESANGQDRQNFQAHSQKHRLRGDEILGVFG